MHHLDQLTLRRTFNASLLLTCISLFGLTHCASDDPSDLDPVDTGIRDSQDFGVLD